ncbi:MAG: hypothetical protein WDO14_07020 [Bacteroidota bacterium]
MNTPNPNVVILNRAWAMLWDPKSSFYIPGVLAKGGTFGNVTIPPLQTLALKNMDNVPLYSSSFWGNVEISLDGMTLSGIPQVNGTAFTPSDDASQITGTIAFSNLILGGSYKVVGSGLVGCAMDLGLEKIMGVGTKADRTANSSLDPPSNLDLARQYRDQLVKQGGNGVQLVSTYYDQNDTINTILTGSNAFTAAWPNAKTDDHDTKYYMEQTNAAAQNPDNPAYTVGGDGYNMHAFYMQSIMLAVAINMANGSTDPDNPYVSLQKSIICFKKPAAANDQQQTVGSVMQTVQNAPTPECSLNVPESDVERKAREMAEKDYPMWEAKAAAEAASVAAAITTYTSSGAFEFGFAMPTITFNGTVTIGGISPNVTMTISITSLSSVIPNVAIILLVGTDPALTSDAQEKINNAVWFQQNIGLKVQGALNQQSLLNTISNIFNQAIISILP